MNRAPGPNDRWFPEHQASCGGTFVKIKEPEGDQDWMMTEQCGIDLFSSSGFGQKKSSKRKLPLGDSSNQKDIRSFVVGGGGAKQDGKGKRPAKGPSMAKGKSSSSRAA